jgi:peptide/nickel transport system ATP-binding protein
LMAGKNPILEIEGLKTQFFLLEGTVTALDGIDLTVYENESLGIVGETGCGKSMTAFSVLGLVPGSGQITGGNVFFMEPQRVRSRRIELMEEARRWYAGQTPFEKKRLVALYDLRDPRTKMLSKRSYRRFLEKLKPPTADRGNAAERLFRRIAAFRDRKLIRLFEMTVPPAKAPTGVINHYLTEKAKKMPPDDKAGREAALRSYDLLSRTQEEMRAIRGRRVSMIFQDPSSSLDPVFTIGSQLGEVISLHQNIYDRDALREKIVDVLKLVRIAAPESVLRQYPHELSGGMKQRVMIALALSCNPSLLIADEPTTALDVTIQAQILNLLKEVVKVAGSSMILITHNLGVVAETCDRVCLMYAGRIVEIAETFELFENPLHPYAKGLLMAFPKLGEQKEELAVVRGIVPNLMKPFAGCSFVDRCDYAMDVCRRVRPSMMEVKPGHMVACHLYREGGDMRDGVRG